MNNHGLQNAAQRSCRFNSRAALLNLIVAAASVASSNASAQPTTGAFSDLLDRVGISPQLNHQVPLELEFVDSAGKTVRLGECFQDKPVILHLVYYQCPMLCQLSRDGLLDSLSTLSLKQGDDFSVITLSFDPREGPTLSARARAMAVERCGQDAVDRGWHFLTGREPAIAAVTGAVGFRYTFDEQTGQYAHAAGLFVLTPEGKVSRFLSGTGYAPRDLRMALVEASSGKIGSLTDQALLLCYMYDPTVGKYGLAIIAIMRVAGIATLGALGTSIFVMIRRDRQRQRDFALANVRDRSHEVHV